MLRRLNKSKAQSVTEYAMLFVLVVAGIRMVQVATQKALAGKIQTATQDFLDEVGGGDNGSSAGLYYVGNQNIREKSGSQSSQKSAVREEYTADGNESVSSKGESKRRGFSGDEDIMTEYYDTVSDLGEDIKDVDRTGYAEGEAGNLQ